MALDSSKTAKAQEWLSRHMPNGCRNCGGKSLQAPDIIAPPIYTPGTTVIGGASIPLLPVICMACGHTAMFSAMVMGLAP